MVEQFEWKGWGVAWVSEGKLQRGEVSTLLTFIYHRCTDSQPFIMPIILYKVNDNYNQKEVIG